MSSMSSWIKGIAVVAILWWTFNVSQDIAHLKRMRDYTSDHFARVDKSLEQIEGEIKNLKEEDYQQEVERNLMDHRPF